MLKSLDMSQKGRFVLKGFLRTLLLMFILLSLLSGTALVKTETYRIRRGDLLAIGLWEGDYYQLQHVRHDGMIYLPPYGDLLITGLTPNEARDLVRRSLEEYFPSPQVVLEVKEISGIEISLIGAVENPGIYMFPYQSRLLPAITMAGGLKEEAYLEQAHLMREGFLIPLADKGDFGLKNYSLKEGDVINIPYRNYEIHFLGEVKKPGSIPYSRGLTLLQALVKVEGITWRGDERDILIIRQVGEATDYIEVNIQEILEEKAPDPPLSPGDRVLVGARPFFNSQTSPLYSSLYL